MAFSFRRKREAPRGRYTPNLWPVWVVAPVALIAAGALGWVIYHYAYDHFAQAATDQKPPKPVNINDVLKATVTALTLIGAVLAGLYAYRKQLLAEGDAHRADASQLADRYTTAAEQLGHDQAAVRLAGVYALARLADDWAEQRQVCIDVLCAYLRMPYEPDPTAPGHKAGEREVRQTIIRVIRDHLQDPDARTAWCRNNFNFTGAVFDGGSFSTSHFQGKVYFVGAWFTGGTVDFDLATFSGGTVSFADATFSDGTVHFRLARFSGGTVTFNDARFSGGTVDFGDAAFSGGTVDFGDATFSGGTVDFSSATFSGGTVDFGGAAFSGGTVDFGDAAFSGGTVGFGDAAFSGGTVDFSSATFSGRLVDFDGATFSGGTVTFNRVAFSGGTVYFGDAMFSGGTVYFGGATFSGGTVYFERATLSGGTVTFDDATFSGTVFEWGLLPVPAGA
ncbi:MULTISPECIES: pentapeptide repeat-containing protein [unclassified Streptomyces]|uniref:pentapeptide repeat-containing protein n=1 Tax=unclassified Streptomyces TaxID=2593676 RepID=UPI002E819DCA|nr:pentapeptide repeat-containing protein [Streptomyces sp. NBC_00589]WTI40371.1 pentapeptide repeat-containing protein [Streptomyces sp. NBC_00775]WUB25946.1 pentapeptide repeat-containing protein [Streptomyces sp. NBC_00589]